MFRSDISETFKNLFIEAVKRLTETELVNFVSSVTGSSHFSHGKQIQIYIKDTDAVEFHTCFDSIDIPRVTYNRPDLTVDDVHALILANETSFGFA